MLLSPETLIFLPQMLQILALKPVLRHAALLLQLRRLQFQPSLLLVKALPILGLPPLLLLDQLLLPCLRETLLV
jgi:hypothetical protein